MNMTTVNSTEIFQAGYDPETKKCRVQLKSGLYENEMPMEQEIYDAFSATFQTSQKTHLYFYQRLMEQYDFRKVL